MESNKNSKLYIAIAFLGVVILGLGGYIVYDKLYSPKNSNNKSQEANNQKETMLVSKVYKDNDWVYDAEYEKKVTSDYYSLYNETFYAKDIVVPYINVESDYANNANNEIKKVLDDAVENYNEGASGEFSYIDECNYKYYLNNDGLSVILTYGVGSTDVVHPNYYIYNIDLKTGEELSYKDIYAIAGFNDNNIEAKAESAITEIMHEKMKDFDYPEDYPEGTDFDTYNNESIKNYKESVENNTIKYFLSSNKQLNVVVKLSIPAGQGFFDTIIPVK